MSASEARTISITGKHAADYYCLMGKLYCYIESWISLEPVLKTTSSTACMQGSCLSYMQQLYRHKFSITGVVDCDVHARLLMLFSLYGQVLGCRGAWTQTHLQVAKEAYKAKQQAASGSQGQMQVDSPLCKFSAWCGLRPFAFGCSFKFSASHTVSASISCLWLRYLRFNRLLPEDRV